MGHKQYQISIERNGQMVPVGQINGENYETAQFAYSDQYLKDGNAVPVSISLPLQRESFSVSRTRHFFEGLLPEGFTRRSVAQWLHLDENDYLSILHQLGKECLGAIQMLAEVMMSREINGICREEPRQVHTLLNRAMYVWKVS